MFLNYKEELIELLNRAIKSVNVQRSKTKHVEFLDDFKSTIEKIKIDAIHDSIPKTGTPRGLTRWLGEYIDQMDDKSILGLIAQIDELLATYY